MNNNIQIINYDNGYLTNKKDDEKKMISGY